MTKEPTRPPDPDDLMRNLWEPAPAAEAMKPLPAEARQSRRNTQTRPLSVAPLQSSVSEMGRRTDAKGFLGDFGRAVGVRDIREASVVVLILAGSVLVGLGEMMDRLDFWLLGFGVVAATCAAVYVLRLSRRATSTSPLRIKLRSPAAPRLRLPPVGINVWAVGVFVILVALLWFVPRLGVAHRWSQERLLMLGIAAYLGFVLWSALKTGRVDSLDSEAHRSYGKSGDAVGFWFRVVILAMFAAVCLIVATRPSMLVW